MRIILGLIAATAAQACEVHRNLDFHSLQDVLEDIIWTHIEVKQSGSKFSPPRKSSRTDRDRYLDQRYNQFDPEFTGLDSNPAALQIEKAFDPMLEMMYMMSNITVPFLQQQENCASLERAYANLQPGQPGYAVFVDAIMDNGLFMKKQIQFLASTTQQIINDAPSEKSSELYDALSRIEEFNALTEPFLKSLLPLTMGETKSILDGAFSCGESRIYKDNGLLFWANKCIKVPMNPLAQATVGQVHTAVIIDPRKATANSIWRGSERPKAGQTVVLKLLRPDVLNKYEDEKPTLLEIVKEKSPQFLEQITNGLQDLETELNFVQEAKHLKLGRRSYEGKMLTKKAWIRVPEPYAVYNNEILMMEYTGEGSVGLQDAFSHSTGKDLKDLQIKVAALGMLNLFIRADGGFVNDDLHAGNINYNTQTKQLWVLDFGNARKISKQEVKALQNLLLEYMTWFTMKEDDIVALYVGDDQKYSMHHQRIQRAVHSSLQSIRTITKPDEWVVGIIKAYTSLSDHLPNPLSHYQAARSNSYAMQLMAPLITSGLTVDGNQEYLEALDSTTVFQEAMRYVLSIFPVNAGTAFGKRLLRSVSSIWHVSKLHRGTYVPPSDSNGDLISVDEIAYDDVPSQEDHTSWLRQKRRRALRKKIVIGAAASVALAGAGVLASRTVLVGNHTLMPNITLPFRQ